MGVYGPVTVAHANVIETFLLQYASLFSNVRRHIKLANVSLT